MATDTTIEAPGDVHAKPGHAHPTDLTYVYVAAFLGAVTGAEILVSYVDFFKQRFPLLLITLLSMMIVKFATVAMFFMHLRFDSRIFRRFFLIGLVLATVVYVIVLSTFHVFRQ